MAFTSYGYDGPITEAPWSLLSYVSSSGVYSIGNSTSNFRVTAVANADRTVSVSAGVAYGKGVVDTSDSAVTLQHDTVASGVRYDLVVIRRTYATNTTSVEIVKGTAVESGVFALRNRGLGTVDDQPLALVRVTAGSTTVAIEADLRIWAYNGGIYAKHPWVLWYLDQIGSKVRVLDTVYQLGLDASEGLKWYTVEEKRAGVSWAAQRNNTDQWATNTNGQMTTVNIPNAPAGLYLLSAHVSLAPVGGTVGNYYGIVTRIVANGAIAGGLGREYRSDIQGGVWTDPHIPTVPHIHAGGPLSVMLQARGGQQMQVRMATIYATYIGPATN